MLQYYPFETSPRRLLIFETSPAKQGGAYSETEQTSGEGAYPEGMALMTFTLAYLHTNVSSVLSDQAPSAGMMFSLGPRD